MSHFEKLLAKGNEKADEQANEGAMWDGVYAALQYAASFHCLVEWKDCEELKPPVKGQGKEASDGMVCDSKKVSIGA